MRFGFLGSVDRRTQGIFSGKTIREKLLKFQYIYPDYTNYNIFNNKKMSGELVNKCNFNED
jgi:hypothetical protein